MSSTDTLPLRLTPLSKKYNISDLDLLPDLDLDPANAVDLDACFKAFAVRSYDDLFEEMEFRCLRASMMHYHEANGFSKKCYYLEMAAAILGAASVSGIGAFLLKLSGTGDDQGLLGLPSPRALGTVGLLGVALAALLEFGSKGSSSLFPSMCQRCEGHKQAAVGWRKLSRLTRNYRIQLRNPSMGVEDFMVWHSHLVQQRHKVSAIALVPSATYRAFNDPARVFHTLSRKRNMFLAFQRMALGVQDYPASQDYCHDD